jgi:hypothetical protein
MGNSENNGDGKVQSRVLLRHYWKQNYKAVAAAKKKKYVMKANVL